MIEMQKVSEKSNFFGTHNKLFGREKATQIRRIQISKKKQLRFNVKTFSWFSKVYFGKVNHFCFIYN